MQKKSTNKDDPNHQLIHPAPPKPNNLLVVVTAICMVGWMVFLLCVAIIASR